ncbi:superoxide dismutase family protein [Kribbella sancticallisti]
MTSTKHTAAIAAVLLTAGLFAPTTAQAAPAHQTGKVVTAHGNLRDLQPTTAGPFDHARATLLMIQHRGRSLVILQVRGINRAVAGQDFGAHLHVGPCVTGDGAAAGPHYNSDTVAGRVPPRVNDMTEVWLDFEVTRAGTGFAITQVPFIPLPGRRSVVIHQEPTDSQGAAGPRLACLPVSW